MSELSEEEIRQGAKPISAFIKLKLSANEIFAFRAKPNAAYNGMTFWYNGMACSATDVFLPGDTQPRPITDFTHYAEIGEEQKKQYLELRERHLKLKRLYRNPKKN